MLDFDSIMGFSETGGLWYVGFWQDEDEDEDEEKVGSGDEGWDWDWGAMLLWEVEEDPLEWRGKRRYNSPLARSSTFYYRKLLEETTEK